MDTRFMKFSAKIIVLSFLLGIISGCGTLVNIAEEEPKNKIYVGTRASLGNIHGGVIDVPFSFVLDTVLLPYTIPVSIYNYSKSEPPKK
jgi:uncharacterized protein YceK